MREIKGTTKLLGIIGDPIEHSCSPLMHNAALEHLNLDYVYLPFPVDTNNLEQAFAGFAAVGVVGFNATIPHKQEIISLSLLDYIDPVAQDIGAVNTVWRENNGWHGTNTDVIGFVAPLKEMNRDWTQTVPVVLGNGGAARAVVAGLADLGCPEINIVGRNKDKLARFWQSWQESNLVKNKSVRIIIHYWDNLTGLILDADLIVNTTPVGMHPKVDASPIPRELMQKIKSSAIAYDLIYTPAPTQFLALAQEKGATIIDGLEMLVKQGAAGFEIWTGEKAPVEVMRRVLQEKLYGRID